MYRTGIMRALAISTLVLLISGCAPESGVSDEDKQVEAEDPSSAADSKDALLEVDASAVPDGATVDQLISIDEVRAIIGMDEVFFAVPAG